MSLARDADSVVPGHHFPAMRRWLLLGGLSLALLLWACVPASAQDAGASPDNPAQAEERTPGSPWLLPFDDLRRGEPVTWTIFLTSIVAVTLIVQGFIRVRRPVVLPEESLARIEELINQRQYKELIDFTEADDSFVSRSLHPALKRAPNYADMHEALEAGVAEETSEQFRRLEYINLIANVGPLLGLLGTVVGIMQAFLAMRQAGGAANVGDLAEGISTALGTTMLGLTLAIPCLVVYSILRNKADRLTQEGALLSEEFLLMIKPDAGAQGAAPGARPVAVRGPVPRPLPRAGAPSAPSSNVGIASSTTPGALRPAARPPEAPKPTVPAQ